MINFERHCWQFIVNIIKITNKEENLFLKVKYKTKNH